MKRVYFVCFLIPLLFIYTIPTTAMAEEERSVQEEVIFDILVDRYNNGDTSIEEGTDVDDAYTFRGGDLKGITDKLDDIKELGFSAITLSPIMKNSPDGYHGYWVEDFHKVDEHFGTMEDFEELIEEAHKRDIKVILEMVTNYVGETNDIVTENPDWLAGQKSDEDIQWMDDVDVLDQTNPSVEAFLFDAADFWMEETDVDGYKLHAADEADEGFLHDLATHIKEKDDDFILIADILDPDHSIDDLMEEESIDLVESPALYKAMTETFKKPEPPVEKLYEMLEENASNKKLLYVDNKYTKRFTQQFVEHGRSPLTVWKMALVFMYTAPGTPYIYQGSSIPMYGEGFPENQNLVQFTMEDDDLSEFYHRISSLREKFSSITEGDYQFVDSDGAMSVIKRETEDETIYVAINNDVENRAITVENVDSGDQLRGVLEDDIVRESDDGTYRISLPRESADVFIMESDTGLNWTFIILVGGIFLLFPILITIVSIKQKRQKQARAQRE